MTIILSEETSASPLWREAYRQAGCHGPCDQGRKLCPSPQACRLEDDDSDVAIGKGAAIAVTLVWAVVLVSIVCAVLL